jgi:hypothetical protein
MKKRSIRTYLELVVPSCLVWTEQEPLGVRNSLVKRKEVIVSAIGFNATTPAFIVAPFIFIVTLNPISDPNVGGASKER